MNKKQKSGGAKKGMIVKKELEKFLSDSGYPEKPHIMDHFSKIEERMKNFKKNRKKFHEHKKEIKRR
jgi:hypothetical protein